MPRRFPYHPTFDRNLGWVTEWGQPALQTNGVSFAARTDLSGVWIDRVHGRKARNTIMLTMTGAVRRVLATKAVTVACGVTYREHRTGRISQTHQTGCESPAIRSDSPPGKMTNWECRIIVIARDAGEGRGGRMQDILLS